MAKRSARDCQEFDIGPFVEFTGSVDFTSFTTESLTTANKVQECKAICLNDPMCSMWSVAGATCRKFKIDSSKTSLHNGLVINPMYGYNSGLPNKYLIGSTEPTRSACKTRCKTNPLCNFYKYDSDTRQCNLNTVSSPHPTGFVKICSSYACVLGKEYISSDNTHIIKFADALTTSTTILISSFIRGDMCYYQVTGTIASNGTITFTGKGAVSYTLTVNEDGKTISTAISTLSFTRNDSGVPFSLPTNTCCSASQLQTCVNGKEYINMSNGITIQFHATNNTVNVFTSVMNLCFTNISYTVNNTTRTISFNFDRNMSKKQQYVIKSITNNGESFYMDRIIINKDDGTTDRAYLDLYFVEKSATIVSLSCTTGSGPANTNYNANYPYIGTSENQLTLEGLQLQGTPDPDPKRSDTITFVFLDGSDELFMHTSSKGCRRFRCKLINGSTGIKFAEYTVSVPHTETFAGVEQTIVEIHESIYVIDSFVFDAQRNIIGASVKRIYERFNYNKTSKLLSVTSSATNLVKITGFNTSVCLQCNSKQYKKCEYTDLNPVTQICKDGTAPVCENIPPIYPFTSEMIFVHPEFFDTRIRFLPDGTCTTDNILFIRYRRFDKYIVTENDDVYVYQEITYSNGSILYTIYSYQSDIIYYNIENCLYKKTLIKETSAKGKFHCLMFLELGKVQYRMFTLGNIAPVWDADISIKMPGNYNYRPIEYGFSTVRDNDYFEQLSDADAPSFSDYGTYSVNKSGSVTISGFMSTIGINSYHLNSLDDPNRINGTYTLYNDYTFGTFYPYYKQLISGLNGYDRSPSTITNSWTTSQPVVVNNIFEAAYEADIRENVVGFEYDRSNNSVYFISFNDEPNIKTNIDDLVSPYSLKIQSTNMIGGDSPDEDYNISEGLVAREFYIHDTDLNETETFHCGFVDNVFKSQRIAPISQGSTNQDNTGNQSFVENLSTRIENNTPKPGGWWGGYTQEELDGFKSFVIRNPTSHNSNKIVYMRSSHPTRGNIFRGIHHKYRLPMHYRCVIGNICDVPVNLPIYSIVINGISITLTQSNPLKLYKVDDDLYIIRVPLLNQSDFDISVREEFGMSENPANYDHQSFLLNDFTTSGVAVDACYWFRNGTVLTSATNPNITLNINTLEEPSLLKNNVLEVNITGKDTCTYKLTDVGEETYKYIYTNNCLYILTNDEKSIVRVFNFSGMDGELYDVISGSRVNVVVHNESVGHAITWLVREDIRHNESIGTMVKNFLSSYLLNLVEPPHEKGIDNIGVNFFYYFLLVGSYIFGPRRGVPPRVRPPPVPRPPSVRERTPPPTPTGSFRGTPPSSTGTRTPTGSFRGTETPIPNGGNGTQRLQLHQGVTVRGGSVQTSTLGETPSTSTSRVNAQTNGSFREAANNNPPGNTSRPAETGDPRPYTSPGAHLPGLPAGGYGSGRLRRSDEWNYRRVYGQRGDMPG